MTNNDVIKAALKELKLLGTGGTVKANTASDMLDTLNRMMSAWEAMDLNFNWFYQDTLSATCPIPQLAEEGVISNLAVKAAPIMAATITKELADKAIDGMNTITTYLINNKIEPADMSHIPLGSARRYDIVTDN